MDTINTLSDNWDEATEKELWKRTNTEEFQNKMKIIQKELLFWDDNKYECVYDETLDRWGWIEKDNK
jgi:hypothetical protein